MQLAAAKRSRLWRSLNTVGDAQQVPAAQRRLDKLATADAYTRAGDDDFLGKLITRRELVHKRSRQDGHPYCVVETGFQLETYYNDQGDRSARKSGGGVSSPIQPLSFLSFLSLSLPLRSPPLSLPFPALDVGPLKSSFRGLGML